MTTNFRYRILTGAAMPRLQLLVGTIHVGTLKLSELEINNLIAHKTTWEPVEPSAKLQPDNGQIGTTSPKVGGKG